ncbi:molybdopterin-binding protein [Desulfitobacterium dehalogenans]|uniref:molybdopterin-binding protein n=1 Tax=Desulfitobacterium dehalogenans TaxID=36854 RepID=UPI00024984A3|nr:molybdopterin-binding protein [Desulfitobacterium dehalogenans]
MTCYPIIKDKPEELAEALDKALNVADLVLINGGSSKGAEDFNTALLEKKADLFRHGIRAIPGRPVGIAMIGGKPVINMPGPTFATFLAMDWCVSGLIHHNYGLTAPRRPKLKVRLTEPLHKRPDYEFYFRLILDRKEGGYEATPMAGTETYPILCCKWTLF